MTTIYIGGPVENKSEYDCISTVFESLRGGAGWSYIFANFHAAGRQIDLAVFTANTTLLIEAKGYSLPTRGEINGHWVQFGPYGKKRIGNAYNQALSAKNALRDCIQKIKRTDGYPNAAVVITPQVSTGSRLTAGDFKVEVGGLDVIEYLLKKPSEALLTQEECESLAKLLNLELVMDVTAALSYEVYEADKLCSTYVDAFRDFHKPYADELIEDEYELNDQVLTLKDINSMLSEGARSLQFLGPTGCGKTLLLKACSIFSCSDNCVPIFVSAKDFEGHLNKVLEKELSLLGIRSAASLIKFGKKLGKRIILFIDGYNECPEHYKIDLTRSIKAFSIRFEACIVVTTQSDLFRADLLLFEVVHVKRPSEQLKVAICGLKDNDGHYGNLHSLLQVVGSGLEISLVAKVGALLPNGASSFVLFSTYARNKLATAAPEGISVLSCFANELVERGCFTLSNREFDRLCDSQNLNSIARQQLSKSKLLQERGDRVSFIHEMFFSMFSAEAAIRSAGRNLESIKKSLTAPKFFSAKIFILGGIEDELILNEVISGCKDRELISACARGECGVAAQLIVARRIEKILELTAIESQNGRFQITGEGWGGVGVDVSCIDSELEGCDAYIAAIGESIMQGRYVDIVMTACQNLDNSIEIFKQENLSEIRLKKIPVQSSIFSSVYAMQNEFAVSKVISFVHGGSFSLRKLSSSKLDEALCIAWKNAKTPGQFYFLLRITKLSQYVRQCASYIVQLMSRLTSLPYHLQLDLIDFCRYAHQAEEPYKTQIIDALQDSLDKLGPVMNGIIFEALQGLGALETDEQNYVPVVLKEIEDVLNDENSSNSDQVAWSLYSQQFDHPYEGAYWSVIQGLDDLKRKMFFIKACRGASSSFTFFLGILIRKLSEFNDPTVASSIERWTILPEKQNVFPQDAVEVFVTAHEALGYLGVPLPTNIAASLTFADQALLACGELYYWSNRIDIDDPQDSFHTQSSRKILLTHSNYAGAAALLLTTSHVLSADGMRKSLINEYPKLALEVCRQALAQKDMQISYFEHSFMSDIDSIAKFAIQVLAKLGNVEDLSLLKIIRDDEEYGVDAIRAMRTIEERVRFRH